MSTDEYKLNAATMSTVELSQAINLF